MKLQILVPHYQENPEEMEPLLDSLAVQQSVDFYDFGVIIAFDGPDSIELPEGEWKSKYPFKIDFVKAPKGGVSATRNAALDASTSDYVMFCDADDMFCDVCGIHILFREMDKPEGFDTLVSRFREETRHPETKEVMYIDHDIDSTFVHGKVHRRKYLLENDLRFNPNLTVHEDSYFNILARELADQERAKYCPMAFYLWRWRDASVCRHDPKYILKTYGNMLDSNDALVDEFVRRVRSDKASYYTAFMIFDAYYTMNKKEWMDEVNEEYRSKVEERFKHYFKKHRDLWENIDDREKMALSNGIRTRSVNEGMLMEAVTLDQWLKSLDLI